MKNLILLVLSLIIVISLQSCKEKTGTLEGTAYWKYNDYVGNKPDAGTIIKLFEIGDSIPTYTTEVGLDGKFKIENIKIGKYLMISKSKNTNESCNGFIQTLEIYVNELDSIFNYNVAKSFNNDFNTYDSLYNKFHSLLIADHEDSLSGLTKHINAYREAEKSLEIFSEQFVKKLPSNFKSNIGLIIYDKIDFLDITIEKDKTTVEQLDFGVTYF